MRRDREKNPDRLNSAKGDADVEAGLCALVGAYVIAPLFDAINIMKIPALLKIYNVAQ